MRNGRQDRTSARRSAPSKKRRRCNHPEFKLPGIGRITGRVTSIRGAFFAAITPVVIPTEAEVDEALSVLDMSRGDCVCAYCGGPKSEWDHLRAIVRESKPTGYITELANLVPSCGKCNQSKGNTPWEEWMRGDAERSPKKRGIADIEDRIARLRAYECWRTPTRLNYQAILGKESWAQYEERLKVAIEQLVASEELASQLRETISAHMTSVATQARGATSSQEATRQAEPTSGGHFDAAEEQSAAQQGPAPDGCVTGWPDSTLDTAWS